MEKYKKQIIISAAFVIGVILLSLTYSLARYVYNSVLDYYLQSKGFYFTSDDLDSTVNDSWNGESIHFAIKNSISENAITNYDISYDVVCTIKGAAASYAACHMNGTTSSTDHGVLSAYEACSNTTDDNVDVRNFNKSECELGGYVWKNQIAVKNLYFDVVLTDEEHELSDVTVNVNVKSTSPYTKTLKGDFILYKDSEIEEEIQMDFKNYTNNDKLIISNPFTEDKCLSITWNADKLLIHEDKNKFISFATDSNDYINEVIFNIPAKTSISYLFYRKDLNSIYNVSEFSITNSNKCNSCSDDTKLECSPHYVNLSDYGTGDIVLNEEILNKGDNYLDNGATIEVNDGIISITGRPSTGWSNILNENLLRWTIFADLTNYNKLGFYAKYGAPHGSMGVFIDTNIRAMYYSYYDAGWHDASNWRYFELDLSGYTGIHSISLMGGYVDSSGSAASNTQFKDIKFIK